MSSTALMSSLRPLRRVSADPGSASAVVVVEDVSPTPVSLSISTTATTPTPPPSRKRPRPFRRPPPLLVPVRPPTSLPTSFYDDHPSDAPPPTSDLDPPALAWPADSASAAASRRGQRRRANEDRVFASAPLSLYGVCDGHGGDEASALVAARFAALLVQAGGCFANAFAAVDKEICAAQRKPSFVGSTLTAVIVDRGRGLKVAHVGDSRAMLVDGEGRGITLTRDHSPNRQDEVRRIEKAGGGVLHGRVNGVLAVSRAVGDTALKSVVIAEPEELEYTLRGNEQILVLASDGLWDLVSDSEVAAFLRSLPLAKGAIAVPRDLKDAAEALVELAVKRGSKDDTSVVLVDLRA